MSRMTPLGRLCDYELYPPFSMNDSIVRTGNWITPTTLSKKFPEKRILFVTFRLTVRLVNGNYSFCKYAKGVFDGLCQGKKAANHYKP